MPPLLDLLLTCAHACAARNGSGGEVLTLGQLRSGLSHEPASKFARLASLFADWRAGDCRPGDPATAGRLLDELRDLYKRHACIASSSLRSLLLLAETLGAVRSLRRRVLRIGDEGFGSPSELEPLRLGLGRLRQTTDRFVERLTSRHAVRAVDLVDGVVQEIRRESSRGSGSETIVFVSEIPAARVPVWISRAREAQWSDLLRNLMRNAVQATEEERGRRSAAEGIGSCSAGAIAGRSAGIAPVRVRVSPLRGTPVVRVEIVDEGVGMDAEGVRSMWRTGEGRHGPGRGHGLTEGKLAFLLANGSFDVRSAEETGTSVIVDIPSGEIALSRPSPWRRRPLQGMAAVLAFATVVAGPALMEGTNASAVEDDGTSVVRGVDSGGTVVWEHDLGVVVPPCNPYGRSARIEMPRAVHRNPDGSIRDLVIATEPQVGSGELVVMDGKGRFLRRQALSWIRPKSPGIGKLKSSWQYPVEWGEPPRNAFAVEVRDSDYFMDVIQVISPDGAVLASYCHPGHLKIHSQQDMDGDGEDEIVLFGINNRGSADSTLARGVEGTWFGCVVLLGSDDFGAQAFPYVTWDGLPPATEKAYLLIPPIREGANAQVTFVHVGDEVGGGPRRIDVWLEDGRSVRVDPLLHPLSVAAGDGTPAAEESRLRGALPGKFAHFREGVRSVVEVRPPVVSDE